MADIDVAAVRAAESTRRWLSSRLDLWGPKAVTDDLVPVLARFCDFAGKTPDEMVDECLRTSRDREGLVLRTRARREWIGQIERYEQATGSRDEANVVRSFFIHNGVAMNPAILA